MTISYDYSKLELKKLNVNSDTVSLKMTDFEGNKTNTIGCNSIEDIDRLITFLEKRKEKITK